MDAQELRNLQEAYLEVYQEQELNEVHGRGRIDPYSVLISIRNRIQEHQNNLV